MKILFSSSFYTPYLSGLTLGCQRIAEELAKRNHQISVLTIQYDKSLPLREKIDNVSINRVPYLFPVSKGFFAPLWLSKSITGVRDCETVIINLPQFEGFLPALVARIFGKKVISIYACEVVLPSGIVNRLIESVLHLADLLTLAISHRIIVYSKDYAKSAKLLKMFTKKLVFVYPPIIKPLIDQQAVSSLAKKISKDDIFKIGFLGRIAEDKGLEYLLKAIPCLENSLPKKFKIVIAGPPNPVGEEKYRQKINNLINKYPDRTAVLGLLKNSGLGAFYSLLDVLVLPSVNSTEAFGMVQVEAMLFGVPVVASDLPGVRVPISKTGMGILVPARDSNEIAKAITSILFNKKFIRKTETINKIFSLEQTIRVFESLIRVKR